MHSFTDFTTHCQYKSYKYIDTIQFFFKRWYPIKLIDFLKNKKERFIFKIYKFGTWCQLQQPSKAELYLIRRHSYGMILTRVDIAFDIETRRPLKLVTDIDRLIRLKYRRPYYNKNRVKDTIYFRETKTAPRNIILYGDKPSKVTHKPCAHIELRVSGHRNIKINNLTLDELIAGVDYMGLLMRFITPRKSNKKGRLNTTSGKGKGSNFSSESLFGSAQNSLTISTVSATLQD